MIRAVLALLFALCAAAVYFIFVMLLTFLILLLNGMPIGFSFVTDMVMTCFVFVVTFAWKMASHKVDQ